MPAEMEFAAKRTGQGIVLSLKGRLDASSSELLDREVDELVRSGGRLLSLDMGGVTYMSSAGIRSLVKTSKAFKKFGGSFGIINPSKAVHDLLRLTNLEVLLCGLEHPAEKQDAHSAGGTWSRFDSGDAGLSCEIRRYPSVPPFKCVLVGDPGRLQKMEFGEDSMYSKTFSDDEFCVGLGAFGLDFQDCLCRFGEFIAVAGAAACLPANDIKFPDFVSRKDNLRPEMKILYSIGFKGAPSSCLRFETSEARRHASFSEIVGPVLEASGSPALGVVMVAESAGLLGASLKKSPAESDPDGFFGHPGIASRLDFSPERVFERSMALVCGVVSSCGDGALSTFLRPVGSFLGKKICGHLHAAAFSYHAVPKAEPDLGQIVHGLFEDSKLLGILHLICDDREISGAGESLFTGGLLWAGNVLTREGGAK